jgi:glutamate-1-semialdehyde aminotransferase
MAATPATRTSPPDTRPSDNSQNRLALAEAELSKASDELETAQRDWERAVMSAAGQLDAIPEVAAAHAEMLECRKKLSGLSVKQETDAYFAALKAIRAATLRYDQAVFANVSHLRPDARLRKADEARTNALRRRNNAKAVEMEVRPSVIIEH